MVNVPLRLPAVVGVKATLIRHDCVVGTAEHWVVAAKSPDVATPVTVIALPPVLVIATVWSELVDPTD